MAIEAELKYDLQTEANVGRLVDALGDPVAVHSQTNRYYDTPQRALGAQRAILRLRTVEGRAGAIATLKCNAVIRDGYQTAEEIERELSQEVADAWMKTPNDLSLLGAEIAGEVANRTSEKAWREIGRFANLRRVFVPFALEKWEVDRTEFPAARIDFELEIETQRPEKVRAQAEALLGRLDIALIAQRKTKFARFLESLG